MQPHDLVAYVKGRSEKLAQAWRRKRAYRGTALDPAVYTDPRLRAMKDFAQPLGDNALSLASPASLLDVDETGMSAGFVVSTPRRDRHGDVVEPAGCAELLKDYEDNPLVFFNHDTEGYPIGTCKGPDGSFRFQIEDDRIVSRCFWHGKTEESDKTFELVAAGILKAASIGFFPLFGELIDGAQQADDGTIDFDFGGVHFTKWWIHEWSVVNIGANAGALRGYMASPRGRSIKSEKFKKSLLNQLPAASAVVRGGFTPETSMPPTTKADVAAAPQQGQSPGQPKVDPAPDPLKESDDKDVQAVCLHTTRFKTPEEASQWLLENGYSADNLIPGDEADEPYVAVQFDADVCVADTAERKEVEEGVELVICVKGEEEDTDDKDEEEADHASDDMNATPPPGKSAGDAVTKDARPAAMPPAGDETAQPVEEDKVRPGEDEEDEAVPHGARVLKEMHAQMCGLHDYLGKAMQPIEHPQVKKYLEKMYGVVGKHKDDVHDTGAKHYPEHFKGDKKKEPDAENDTQDDTHGETDDPRGEDRPTKSAGVKGGVAKMAKKDLGVVTDAAEFIDELHAEAQLSKTQKAACKLHSQMLKGVQEKYAGDQQAEKVAAEKAAADARQEAERKALEQAVDAFNDVRRLFFEATGIEV